MVKFRTQVGRCQFESGPLGNRFGVAQLAEQRAVNSLVAGSIPASGARLIRGGVVATHQTLNLVSQVRALAPKPSLFVERVKLDVSLGDY